MCICLDVVGIILDEGEYVALSLLDASMSPAVAAHSYISFITTYFHLRSLVDNVAI